VSAVEPTIGGGSHDAVSVCVVLCPPTIPGRPVDRIVVLQRPRTLQRRTEVEQTARVDGHQ
jgi:hypothetical protein